MLSSASVKGFRSLAKNKIRCNCLCPGPVDTPLTRQGTNISLDAPIEDLNAKLLELGILDAILLKRLGSEWPISV